VFLASSIDGSIGDFLKQGVSLTVDQAVVEQALSNSASPATGLIRLRVRENYITLAQLPAESSHLTRYRLFRFQFKFLAAKDDV